MSLSIFVAIMSFLKTRTLLKEIKSLEVRLEDANKELTLIKSEVPLNLDGLIVP